LVIGMLIAIELLGVTERPWQRSLKRLLRVSTAPLVFVFVVSLAAKALVVLGAS